MEQEQSVGSVSARPSPFSEQTFDLLAQLHEEPKRTFYLDNKERFKEYLEKPFQQLVDEVGQHLPQEILTTIETESDVYARILKNDYGQGGAWDFYWAAFHPLDVKRTEGPQLFVWMNHEQLRFGYSIGRKDSQYGKIFGQNCEVHQLSPV